MKRKLLRQVTNEWVSNLWIIIELLIVSVVLWYIVDFLYVSGSRFFEPRGFNIERCFTVSLDNIPSESVDYDPTDSTNSEEHMRQLLDRFSRYPGVEAVGYGSYGSFPYDLSFAIGSLYDAEALPGDTLNIDGVYSDERQGTEHSVYKTMMSPGLLKVLDIHGIDGESPEELGEILERGEILLSSSAANGTGRTPQSLRGHKFYIAGDSSRLVRVGAVIPYLNSEGDFSGGGNNVKYVEMAPMKAQYQVMVRVMPGYEKDFAESVLNDAERYFRIGNDIVGEVTDMQDRRADFDREARVEVRNWLVCMLFLMVSIFLGVLGTFWFRTQQRSGEIALRMVAGATRGDVFRRMTGEGLMLLIIATVPAIAVDFAIAHYELNNELYGRFLTAGRFAVTTGITFALMTLMVIFGTWWPALRAMRVQPAMALADE